MADPKITMLVLDDDETRVTHIRARFPNAEIRWVDNVPDCIACLSEPWDAIRLDHDLGGEVFVDSERADCGMEVVRHILGNRPKHLLDTTFIVHTRHTRAGIRMTEALQSAGYDCTYRPFSWQD